MASFKASARYDFVAIYGASALISTLAFVVALTKGLSMWGASAKVSALDIAVFAFVAAVGIASMGGLVFSNFAFLGEKKDWQDFWSKDMLEYFTKARIEERWRIARGRFILFSFTFVSGFLTIQVYGYLKNFVYFHGS